MTNAQPAFRMGRWDVFPVEGVLRSGEEERRLQPRVMELLCRLLQAPGTVVTREVLLRDIWQGRAMSDEPLHRCIADLRSALGDDSSHPSYIETLPRRGYRLIAAVQHAAPEPSRRFRLIAPVSVLVFVAVFAAGWIYASGEKSDPPRVLVMPLENLSPDDANALLVDGLTEELLNALANNRHLRVLSRTTTFSLRPRKLERTEVIARTQADYFIEGSARIVDEHLRITVQLIDVKTDAHLFSEVFEQPLADAPTALTRIATRASAAVGRSIVTSGTPAGNLPPAVFQDFVQARMLVHSMNGPGLLQAVARLERIVLQEPEFASGHAYLAAALFLTSKMPGLAQVAPERIDRHLDEALRLDSNNALARAVLSRRETTRHTWSEHQLKLALQADPELQLARFWLAQLYMRTGRINAALEQFQQLRERDPLWFHIEDWVARAEYAAGHRERYFALLANDNKALWKTASETVLYDAIAAQNFEELRRVLQMFWMHSRRASLSELEQIAAGILYPAQRASALRLVDRLRTRELAIPPVRAFEFYVLLGDVDRAFDLALDPAGGIDASSLYFVWMPTYTAFRRDPRFVAYVQRFGLVEYLESAGGNDFCTRQPDAWRCR